MGQWSDLPRELLEKIEEHLIFYVDEVRVRAVCEWWNSCLKEIPTNHHPWLLQPLENDPNASHALFDVDDKICYKLDLPEAKGKVFKGCSYGWLVTIEDVEVHYNSSTRRSSNKSSMIINSPVEPLRSTSLPEDLIKDDNTENDDTNATRDDNPTAMYLINPLTKEIIQLPPRNTFPDVYNFDVGRVGWEYIFFLDIDKALLDSEVNDNIEYGRLRDINFLLTNKVVLSSTPSEEDCCVVAIFSFGKLAWCKCNDNAWKLLPTGEETWVKDIIFYEDKLLALTSMEKIFVFENFSSNPEVTAVWGLPNDVVDYIHFSYLVKCSDGELVMVKRYANQVELGDSKFCTYMIKVWKFDNINFTWTQVESVGDDILFLGMNASFSISSKDIPGWKGNCIHFSDTINAHRSRGIQFNPPDVGIYDLDDKSFKPLPGFGYDLKYIWPPPIWLSRSSPYN